MIQYIKQIIGRLFKVNIEVEIIHKPDRNMIIRLPNGMNIKASPKETLNHKSSMNMLEVHDIIEIVKDNQSSFYCRRYTDIGWVTDKYKLELPFEEQEKDFML